MHTDFGRFLARPTGIARPTRLYERCRTCLMERRSELTKHADQVSLWLGEITTPDWDMFQSGHPAGHLHAVARVIGGSPIYVSDKPSGHATDLLRNVALADGAVLLADGWGRPAPLSIFVDPIRENQLYQVVNTSGNGRALLVAVFNLHPPEGPAISDRFNPWHTWPTLEVDVVVFAHYRNELRLMSQDEPFWDLTLAAGHCELFTVMPARPLVVFGLDEFFNTAATVVRSWSDLVELVGGRYADHDARLVCWSATKPIAVVDANSDAALHYDYNEDTHRLNVYVPASVERIAMRVLC